MDSGTGVLFRVRHIDLSNSENCLEEMMPCCPIFRRVLPGIRFVPSREDIEYCFGKDMEPTDSGVAHRPVVYGEAAPSPAGHCLINSNPFL